MQAAFAETEYRDRLRRGREALQKAQLDGAICVAPEHLNYFAGYDAHTHFDEQALVFSAGSDEPTLIVRDGDIGTAQSMSWVGDKRGYSLESGGAAPLVTAVAEEKGLVVGRIGIELYSYAFNVGYYLGLSTGLGPGRISWIPPRFWDGCGLLNPRPSSSTYAKHRRIIWPGSKRRWQQRSRASPKSSGQVRSSTRFAGTGAITRRCRPGSGVESAPRLATQPRALGSCAITSRRCSPLRG